MNFAKLFSRAYNIISHPQYHLLNSLKFSCNVCGHKTLFLCDIPADRHIRKCIICRSTPKYRAIVKAVELSRSKPLNELMKAGAELYEMSTTSPIHRKYRCFRNYTCSGYFWDRPFGVELRSRVYNQDCQNLSFPDASFDMVISSETMEHVREPFRGFKEIRRVLKPDGVYFFTIPYRDDRLTTSRVDVSGEDDVHTLPKVYHQDPYRREDSLVYTDFGADLPELLRPLGFDTQLIYVTDENSDIQDDLEPMKVFVAIAVNF